MRLGVTAFLTDRDMTPAALAGAVEQRGFSSLYLPEHTHLPVRADVPPALVEGVRMEDYRRGLCPLVALSTAVATTERIVLGTGILLAAQHDPIDLAKQIATLDYLSGGRFTLGIGFGWNRAEAEDHGVDFARRHAIVREYLLCMQALWSQEQAEFHGEFVDLPPAWAWPKPLQQPRVRVLIGGGSGDAVLGAVADYADGWMPIGGSGLAEAIPRPRSPSSRSARSAPPQNLNITRHWESGKSCCAYHRAMPTRCWPSWTPWRPCCLWPQASNSRLVQKKAWRSAEKRQA
jgi:probable F420-dependent oxidoreductase